MIQQVKHIAIIGSGNVATYMARLLRHHGYTISTIISRNKVSGNALAREVNAIFSVHLDIRIDTDLVMLCVNDDELHNVSNAIPPGDYVVCHCAGAQSIDVLSKHNSRAVVYPLQSINLETSVEYTEVPFLIEAVSTNAVAVIERILNHCGKRFYKVGSAQRLKYHLAAVFANNFTNAMLVATQAITDRHQLDFELLKPLIAETFNRLDRNDPAQMQTGPAKRNDTDTLQKHLELLDEQEEMILYKVISGYINKKFTS